MSWGRLGQSRNDDAQEANSLGVGRNIHNVYGPPAAKHGPDDVKQGEALRGF